MVATETDSNLNRSTDKPELESWWERNRFRIYLVTLIGLILFLFLVPYIYVTVPPGHRGVLFRRLGNGTRVDRTYGEGLQVKLPWDTLTVYETRVQQANITFPALTRDALRIDLSISVRYLPHIPTLGVLHKTIGPEYFERVIQPEIKSALRETVGDRTAFQLYSTEGGVLRTALDDARSKIEAKPIRLDRLLIEKIHLPPVVRSAIEAKHKQEQKMLEYEFRLETTEREAERQRIEAAGIRDYQMIIAQQGISDDVLKWRGIEATLKLADSQNAKMIVIGGDPNSLPVILNHGADNLGSTATDRPDKESENTSTKDNANRPANVSTNPPTSGP